MRRWNLRAIGPVQQPELPLGRAGYQTFLPQRCSDERTGGGEHVRPHLEALFPRAPKQQGPNERLSTWEGVAHRFTFTPLELSLVGARCARCTHRW